MLCFEIYVMQYILLRIRTFTDSLPSTGAPSLRTVSPKNDTFYFCEIFGRRHQILLIFATNM